MAGLGGGLTTGRIPLRDPELLNVPMRPRTRTVRMLALTVTAMLLAGLALLSASAQPGPDVQVAASSDGSTPPQLAIAPTSTVPFVCPVTPGLTRTEHIARHHADGATVVEGHAGHAMSGVPTTAHAHAPDEHATNPAPPHATHPARPWGHHGGDATCQPTPEQVTAAQQLVDATKAAIDPRFADERAARAAGYAPAAGSDTVQRAVHYGNKQETNTPGTLDPNHPESLVYGDTDRHGRVLLGVVYIVAERGEDGPPIGGCLTPWHRHGVQAYARDMLHVWIVDMPGGPFGPPDSDYIRSL